jgi:proteasome lid subunit RPN8/RPN11
MTCLQLPQSIYDQIREHGEASYPDECCGILLGILTPEVKLVTRAIVTINASATPHNHYQIASKDLIRIDRESRQADAQILGFYHSHPDHPAQPSATDLAEAHWLGCSYLITTVAQGHATITNSFYLAGQSEEDKHFEAEAIRLSATQSGAETSIATELS